MSLELTENTSNIGSSALNDLVFTLYCRVIRQWLLTNRQSVGDQLGSDRQPIGDRSATGRRLYLGRLFLIAETLQPFWDRSATDRRLVGDQSANKNCVGIVYNRCNWSAISRQPVGDQSATCRRPPPTFLRSIWSQRGFTCSNQNLLATKSSLQPSATGRRPVADHLATTLQPAEILVARKSPTGCKLCVTGALLGSPFFIMPLITDLDFKFIKSLKLTTRKTNK